MNEGLIFRDFRAVQKYSILFCSKSRDPNFGCLPCRGRKTYFKLFVSTPFMSKRLNTSYSSFLAQNHRINPYSYSVMHVCMTRDMQNLDDFACSGVLVCM